MSSSNFRMIGIITDVKESENYTSIKTLLRLITSPAMISILIIRIKSHKISRCIVSRIKGRTSSYSRSATFSRKELPFIHFNHTHLTALLKAGEERTVVTNCFSFTSEQKKLRYSSLSCSHTSMINKIALRIRLSKVSSPFR